MKVLEPFGRIKWRIIWSFTNGRLSPVEGEKRDNEIDLAWRISVALMVAVVALAFTLALL